MKRFLCCPVLVWVVLLAFAVGCSEPEPPPADLNQIAKAKVDAAKKLADAMSKGPNGMEARAALDEFRMIVLDVKKNPTEAEEIVDIYRKRIKGKYQGEVAQEVQIEMAPIESSLKVTK